MGFSGLGSQMISDYTRLSQNERAQTQFDSMANSRELRSAQAGLELDVMDVNSAIYNDQYGHKYGYAMELKNRNDQKRQMQEMKLMLSMQKKQNAGSSISASASDQAVYQVGLKGDQRSLETMAKHTTGQEKPGPDGYSSIGPLNVRYIRPQNMTAQQLGAMDRIKANRANRVSDGIYKEQTFADGVKRLVNTASNEVFGTDIWLEDRDKPGEIYSPEHLKMITGQPSRVATTYQASTPKETAQPQTQATPSQAQPQTQTAQPQTAQTEEALPGDNLPPSTNGNVPPEQQAGEQPAETTITPSSTNVDYGVKPVESNAKAFADYTVANPKFPGQVKETITTMASGAKPGSVAEEAMKNMGAYTPEDVNRIMKDYKDFETEMNTMSNEDFDKFYKEQRIAAPATKTEAEQKVVDEGQNFQGTGKTEGMVRRDLVDYVNALSKQTENNARLKKGGSRPSDKEEYFLNQTNNPDTITNALKAGVTTPKELHDFIENKGKFKPMTATEKKQEAKDNKLKSLDDRVFTKGEDGVEKFDIKAVASLSPRETSELQRRYGKPTELKEDKKEYTGHEQWFKAREDILKLRDSRYTAEKLGESGSAFIAKYIGDSASENDVAKLHSRLTALMGSAVADTVRQLSGTAASDKERANIVRFMFGDPMVSGDSFVGALQGRTEFVLNKLPGLAERSYNNNGYNVSRLASSLYEKYANESEDIYKTKAEIAQEMLDGKREFDKSYFPGKVKDYDKKTNDLIQQGLRGELYKKGK